MNDEYFPDPDSLYEDSFHLDFDFYEQEEAPDFHEPPGYGDDD